MLFPLESFHILACLQVTESQIPKLLNADEGSVMPSLQLRYWLALRACWRGSARIKHLATKGTWRPCYHLLHYIHSCKKQLKSPLSQAWSQTPGGVQGVSAQVKLLKWFFRRLKGRYLQQALSLATGGLWETGTVGRAGAQVNAASVRNETWALPLPFDRRENITLRDPKLSFFWGCLKDSGHCFALQVLPVPCPTSSMEVPAFPSSPWRPTMWNTNCLFSCLLCGSNQPGWKNGQPMEMAGSYFLGMV